jgi:acetyl-CoA C-acetyltransferase
MGESIKDKVAIIGMGCCKFGENWEQSASDMLVDAAYEAYEDAGIDPAAIEACWYGTVNGSTAEPCARALKFDYIPVTRVENLCATGTEAFRNACLGVASGLYDVCLAVGVEKLKDAGAGGLHLGGGGAAWVR